MHPVENESVYKPLLLKLMMLECVAQTPILKSRRGGHFTECVPFIISDDICRPFSTVASILLDAAALKIHLPLSGRNLKEALVVWGIKHPLAELKTFCIPWQISTTHTVASPPYSIHLQEKILFQSHSKVSSS